MRTLWLAVTQDFNLVLFRDHTVVRWWLLNVPAVVERAVDAERAREVVQDKIVKRAVVMRSRTIVRDMKFRSEYTNSQPDAEVKETL